jgi:tetratricopeptide (TPR) repeat protein
MAAVLTKEAAMTLPMALLIWEVCIEKTRARLLLKRQLVWWILFAIPSYYVIMHPGYYRLLYGIVGERSFDESLLYQVKGVFYLLSRLVMINRLSVEPGLGIHTPEALSVLLESILLIILLVGALTIRQKFPPVCFGIFWFLLHTFIPYVVLSRRDVLNEHHMYLANAGLFCAIGCFAGMLCEVSRWKKFINPAMVMVCCMLMAQTMLRNLDYRSEVALWESTIRVSPDSPTAYNNLGVAYQLAGRLPAARRAYTKALMLEPAFDKARRNLEKLLRSEQPPIP